MSTGTVDHDAPAGSLASKYLDPSLVAEFDLSRNEPGLDPTTIKRWSNKVRWWTCPLQHPYDAPVAKRSKGAGCPYCSGARVLAGFNDFASNRPALVAEWDTFRNDVGPEQVTTWCNQVAHWICPDGHPYPSPISRRAAGHGCSVCSGDLVLVVVNDLATLRPDLAAEMVDGDPTAVTVGSKAKRRWRCALGHEWPASVKNRARRGSGCPYCSGHKVLAGFNDLATLRPDVAAEWDEEPGRNAKRADEVTVSSHYKAGWICAGGHQWKAAVAGRTGKEAKGCGDCALAGTSRAEQSLYALLAVRWPGAQHRHKVKVNGRKRAYEVDIVWGRVAVEYDGSYFHQGTQAEGRDVAKTQALLDAGFRVVRVREQNNHALAHLPMSHPDLIQLDHRFGTDQADLVVRISLWAQNL